MNNRYRNVLCTTCGTSGHEEYFCPDCVERDLQERDERITALEAENAALLAQQAASAEFDPDQRIESKPKAVYSATLIVGGIERGKPRRPIGDDIVELDTHSAPDHLRRALQDCITTGMTAEGVAAIVREVTGRG